MFVNVNNENLEISKKIKENTVITVKYSGVNVFNKLIHPVFYRSRNSSEDVSWTDLVDQNQSQSKVV